MSGFVAVINLDGAAIDTAQLHRMTNALKFRGPDAQNVWISDHVGFGHAMLQTTEENSRERQPCSLDGGIWITGDVRVDRRKELLRQLAEAGQRPPKSVTDAELVLYSYQVWGEALVDHLLGDFSFAIWDSHTRRLFCVRDQLGVKPLFYCRVGKQLIASNTLQCIRTYTAVSDRLNDAAVGDFLLFGFNCDPRTTTFEAIQRLPGGHSLSCAIGVEPRVEPYWTLPVYKELRLPRRKDYIELFQQILAEAVSDRLRNDHVGIHMSGGLDSSLIAATARNLMAERDPRFDLRAYTVVYDELFNDKERHFSQVVADSLNIPIRYLVADDYRLFDDRGNRSCSFPEPLDGLALPSFFNAVNRQMDTRFRVALSGLDGDALLTASWIAQLGSQVSKRKLGSLAADTFWYALAKQNLIGAIVRRLPFPRRRTFVESDFPSWFEPAFEERTGLRNRWTGMFAGPDLGRGAREGAYQTMSLPTWLPILEGRDAGVTGVPVDHRHPLLDLRMVEFGLSLPAIPWCVDKHILRESARNLLPKSIRTRPKSPLGGDPIPFAIRAYLEGRKKPPKLHPEMGRYIDPGRLPRIIDDAGTEGYWFALRVLILNFWLFNIKGECK